MLYTCIHAGDYIIKSSGVRKFISLLEVYAMWHPMEYNVKSGNVGFIHSLATAQVFLAINIKPTFYLVFTILDDFFHSFLKLIFFNCSHASLKGFT